LFSFGTVLYEMATGAGPFRGESSGVIFSAILEREPVPPARINPDIPVELQRIISGALEKDRNLRYQSAAEMRAELQRLKRDSDSRRSTAVADAAVSTLPASAFGSRSGLRAQPGPARRTWMWKVAAPILVVAALIAGGLYYHSRQIPKLTDKDTVVLADFTNTTGDPVFDGTLRQALSAQLEQSPFLNLLSDERIAQTLSLMAQPKETRLTHELAREVCQRTASAAVLNGSIAQVGTQYLLTLKAVNCSNGEPLASTTAQASDKNQVLDAVGGMASTLRGCV